MFPVLFEIGPIKLYSFGLMVVVAFLAAAAMVTRELRRRQLEPSHLEGYPMGALLGGLLGARLYYIAEHFDAFLADPLGSMFTGAGLTWYGGLLGGALTVLVWARRRQQPLWSICDAFAPGLAASYGIGRIGCQLAGDGDYGPPSDLPWAMAYPKGVVPTLEPCHPTPVYEVLMMAVVVAVLWRARLLPRARGWLFGLYLGLVGSERFVAEFFRVRDSRPGGLSLAQWISVVLVLSGVALMLSRRGRAGHD